MLAAIAAAVRSSRPAGQDGRDPLARVLGLERSVPTGLAIGFTIAALAHGAGAARVLSAPIELQRWASAARARVHDRLWTVYDVEVAKPEPEKEAPKEQPKDEAPPEPAPKPVAKAIAAPKAPANEPPPAAAQAAKVLTQAPDPNEPVDLTGQGFVQGNAETYAGGVTASNGTSKDAVRDANARGDGVPGGKGTVPAAAAPGPDRSRAAGVAGGSSWNCPFPPEADADQIDFQIVPIVVTVRPDGSPQSVKVLNDPGHGFGRAARQCALGQRFQPAFDRDGAPILATTPPINVRFTR